MSAFGPPTDPNDRGSPSGREAYNLVTDTVTGVNIRRWDNLFQAVVSAVCLVLGVATGWLLAFMNSTDQLMGALLGAFIGLLVGLFGSGTFLMIHRLVRHVQGRHD